jgi:hypothetical protein
MRTAYFQMLWLIPILFVGSAWGGQQIKNITVAVSNPSLTARNAADIVIPIAEIRNVAPDFKPGAMVVTVSDASTLEEDASVLPTEELPSQADDLNGDGKVEELVFQVDLAPHQTRIVTISHVTGARICRLRSDYRLCQRNDGRDDQTPVCVGVAQSQPRHTQGSIGGLPPLNRTRFPTIRDA